MQGQWLLVTLKPCNVISSCAFKTYFRPENRSCATFLRSLFISGLFGRYIQRWRPLQLQRKGCLRCRWFRLKCNSFALEDMTEFSSHSADAFCVFLGSESRGLLKCPSLIWLLSQRTEATATAASSNRVLCCQTLWTFSDKLPSYYLTFETQTEFWNYIFLSPMMVNGWVLWKGVALKK